MNDFWQHCSALLERELTPQQYVTWIKPLALVDFDADASTLRIAAPNRFKLDWVKSQFSGRIADMAREFWHVPVDIQFVLDPKATARKAMGGAPAPYAASTFSSAPAGTPTSPPMPRPAPQHAERNNGGHANASAHINALAAEAAQHAQSLQHNDQADNGDLDLPSLDANEAAAARRTWRPGGTASSNGENDSAYERSKLNPVLTFDNFVTGKANQLA
ncbi:MAG TPA: DnaA N-terminal domain-containing protein, partial [Paraburkholderia sp.]|nr:DnaA N-terminal domain-containing protein [Paraburkholderia sp.]